MATLEEKVGTDQNVGTDQIDAAIQQMEAMYRAVSGKDAPPPEAVYAPIPAESDPSQHVDEQMNRLLGLLGRTAAGQPVPAWVPPMSVWESESELLLCLDVPGVPRDRLEVRLEGNILSVSGERPVAAGPGGLRMSERPLGPFRRSVMLRWEVRNHEPTARLRDGILEIKLQKNAARAASPKLIHIG